MNLNLASLVGVRRHEIGDREHIMNSIIWLVGAVVIVLFVAGFLGFR
jgi:hypothetical protein